MNFLRTKLIEDFASDFVQKKCDQIMAVALQGFDVFVCGENALLLKMVMQAVQHRPESEKLVLGAIANSQVSIADTNGVCILFGQVSDEQPGGMMRFEIERFFIDSKAVPKSIEKILKHYSLDCYLDVFDRHIVTDIKSICQEIDVSRFIDIVLQIAYKNGFLGCNTNINEARFSGELSNSYNNVTKIFELALARSKRPHHFLKAALSHYLVRRRNLSSSQASRVLEISRSTLTQHLRLADTMQVDKILFPGSEKC